MFKTIKNIFILLSFSFIAGEASAYIPVESNFNLALSIRLQNQKQKIISVSPYERKKNLIKVRIFAVYEISKIKAVRLSGSQAALPLKVTDAKGQNITFEYDTMDRLIVKHLPEGDVNYSYDLVGNLISITNVAAASYAATYDALNRVTQTQQTVNGQSYTLGYSYDANGNRTSMSTPWGSYNYSYDNLNRLVSITNPDTKTINFTYDSLGRRTKMSLPNGTETTYAYDNASQLTQILHRKTADNTAIAFSNYNYDLAGNRTNMTDLIGSNSYSYDDLHRLISANHPNLPNETFTYDAVGNRLSDTNVTGYSYDSANRLLSNSSYTYTYDANGNLTAIETVAAASYADYTYNSENQLTEVNLPDGSKVNYSYDSLGRRIKKAVSLNASPFTLYYLYDNEDIIAVLDENNTVIKTFTHGPGIDEPLIMKKGTDNYYYHADGLGSIVALTGESANIVESYEYQAYGKPVIKDHLGTVFDKSTVGNPYLYTARELDSETGLFYYRARYYDSSVGRFLQEDPIGFFGGLNLYIYVGGNPINWVDSMGLSAADVERIKAIFRKTVDQMTKDGERTSISFLNNFISMIQKIAGGRLGKPYLICAYQSDKVFDALVKAQQERQFDDVWNFREIGLMFHVYVTAKSNNPTDPKLKLDPFWNSID